LCHVLSAAWEGSKGGSCQQKKKEAKEVEQFYQSTDDQKNDCKNKGRENTPTGSQEVQAELMSHFSKLVCKASASSSAIYLFIYYYAQQCLIKIIH